MPHLTADLFEPQFVEVFKTDCRVVFGLRPGIAAGNRKPPPPLNGSREIRELSMKSRLRLLHHAKNAELPLSSMITLTYPREFPADGRTVKRHLDSFRKALARKFPAALDLWFLEFQTRGAPHVHMMISCRVPFGRKKFARAWVAATWFRIVNSGDLRHLRAGTAWENIRNPEGGARYVAKYATKTRQKSVPPAFRNVGRFWGGSKLLTPERLEVVPVTEAEIVAKCGEACRMKSGRVRKYLWDARPLFQSSNSGCRVASRPSRSNGEAAKIRPPLSNSRTRPPTSSTSELPSFGNAPGKSSRRIYVLRPLSSS